MTEKQLKDLIKQGEGQTIEFKDDRIHPRSLAQTLAAFAAADGGVVLIGVADDGSIPGVSNFKRVCDNLVYEAAGRNHCEPQIQPMGIEKVEIEDGKIVAAVTVPADFETLHSVAGKYFLRIGSRNEPLTPRELRRLMFSRGEVSFELLTDDRFDPKHIDKTLVGEFIRQRQKSGRSLHIGNEELLANIGCLVRKDGQYRPTNAGMLLFCQDPQLFILQSEVICVRFKGTDVLEYIDRKDLSGPLPRMVEDAESFIRKHIKMGARIVGFRRVDYPEYPVEAVREIILNAVIHRDWSLTGQHIRIFMFDDRIEIHSPGKLMPGIAVEQLRKGESHSVLRNPAIVEVFKDLGFIEKLGSGIPRVLRLIEEHGLRKPVFSESGMKFTVALYGPGEEFMKGEVEELLGALNPRQQSLEKYFSENERLTVQDFHKMHPTVTRRTLVRDLSDMVEKGFLERHGIKRGTYYTLA